MPSQLDYDAKCVQYHEAKARAEKAEAALADLVAAAGTATDLTAINATMGCLELVGKTYERGDKISPELGEHVYKRLNALEEYACQVSKSREEVSRARKVMKEEA